MSRSNSSKLFPILQAAEPDQQWLYATRLITLMGFGDERNGFQILLLLGTQGIRAVHST